ncbi:hypothetical protein RI367_006402 [Sorochytrium milnesiophthora]
MVAVVKANGNSAASAALAIDVDSAVSQALPDLDAARREYMVGTVHDADPEEMDGGSPEALYDFFSVLLSDYKHDDKVLLQLCQKLSPVLGQYAKQEHARHESDEAGEQEDGQPAGPLRLPGAPVLMGAAMSSKTLSLDTSAHAGKASMVDIAHAAGRQVASRVDEKKLQKAELKLKAKMQKRQTDVEVSFKVLDRPEATAPVTEQQIRDILAARGKNRDVLLSNFDVSHAGLRILSSATLALPFGRRYGLVGRNGIGKSTLMRAIAHREIVGMDKFKHVSIGHVEQELVGDDLSCTESVMQADIYREFLLKEERRLNELISTLGDENSAAAKSGTETVQSAEAKLKEVFQKLEDIDAHRAEARASSILSGLGFTAEMQKQPTKSFSGGWKMRLALARALFCRPDLLLLDEPTNHLDIPAVVWLSNYLVKWPSTLLVVSHDREFLDTVATDILHMHNERLDAYRGNFTMFDATREERKKQAVREYDAQMMYRQQLQAFIDRWRYNAARAAQAQSKMKILAKLPEIEVPTEEIQVTFTFPEPEKISPPVLQMTDVKFGYTPDNVLLRNINLDVRMDSRVAVVGPNGAGKSTILKLLTGQLEPMSGHVFRHGRLRFAFFSQHHVDALEDLSLTPVQFLEKQYPGHQAEEYRRQLGCFGISGRVGLQNLGTLSGGQKSRVVFAALALQRPSILVLDEPTNHLDYMSVDSLADALRQFRGGSLIVSHDQRFIDMVCNELWVCDRGTLTKFHGEGVKEYKKTLLVPDE